MAAHAQDVYETILAPSQPPEYPYESIPYCYEGMPEVQPFAISFSATWGTTQGYGIGEVDQFEMPGIDAEFYSAAANTTSDLPLGNVAIDIAGYMFGSPTINGMYITMSPHTFLSGEDIITDNLATLALTYRVPNYLLDPTGIELTAIVMDGVLRLDQAGMNPGDTVSGTFTGEIIIEPWLQ
jgi:hypothetical protein